MRSRIIRPVRRHIVSTGRRHGRAAAAPRPGAPRMVLAIAAAMVIALAFGTGAASAQQSRDWSFSGVDRIDLDGVSGDLVVGAASGSELTLELEFDVEPADAFRPEVEQEGARLRIEEHWANRSSGHVRWRLGVPAGSRPQIRFDTASGDLEIEGVEVEVRFDTASGDVDLRDLTLVSGSSFDTASGDFELVDVEVGDDVDIGTASGDIELTRVRAGSGFDASTASGDVIIEDCRGVLDGSSASGNVRVTTDELDGRGDFSSASGNVLLRLRRVSNDLEASSASGDVRLELEDLPAAFTLVMVARQDRGDIEHPFENASRRTFERNDQRYVEEKVTRGSGGPEIRLSTASGTVEFRRR